MYIFLKVEKRTFFYLTGFSERGNELAYLLFVITKQKYNVLLLYKEPENKY